MPVRLNRAYPYLTTACSAPAHAAWSLVPPTVSKSLRCCSRTSPSRLTLHASSLGKYFSGAKRIMGDIGSFL